MFCAPGLIFGGTAGVKSRFQVLCFQTRFRRYGGRRVLFSCFARPDSFSAVPRASGPIFRFCAPGLIFGVIEGVGSRLHVFRSRTRFRRYRWRQVPFSYFARPDTFSSVRRASGPVFMFYAPGLVFGFTESVLYRFLVLRARTRFRRYRGCGVPFSCFARPDSFSVVRRDSGPVFIFCAPGLVFGGTEGVRFLFYVFCTWTRFWRY
jgi:hypothetical protein